MKKNFPERPDGYRESIEMGLRAVRQYDLHTLSKTGSPEQNLRRQRRALAEADAVVVGAGAGLSTAAGYTYSGERFYRYFGDLARKYGFSDMYTGGFTDFASPEERWAFWSRNIYVNRYMDPPKPVYHRLLSLVRGKDYFVITTNVDHCFQRAGFDKKRLFYTQGDYGLWQCARPCHDRTYDNEQTVREMLLAQGFVIGGDGGLTVPEGVTLKTAVPTALVPFCPVCGEPMTMNLRADDTFVEDEGWRRASAAYGDFLRRHRDLKTVYLELGVGANTPVIIKFPFWQMTAENPKALYACVNLGQAFCPGPIEGRSVCIDGDIGPVLTALLAAR
jgi:NAD-dependent SIR2 family protein deacetylase